MPATVKDSARDRDPLPLFPRGETLPEVESHHPYHPAASRQAGKQASRQGGIRQHHHDVAAARHKGNNRGKARGQPPPARPGGKERDERVEQLAPHGYLGGGHLKWPGRRYPVGGGGGSPLGHMPSGQTRGVSGGRRISCPGSAPPWLPCRSPLPGCRARRGAPARCPGYPPDTPWCSGRGAWRGFAGTWR